MKKLTILLLALALTAFAVPAMAGDIAVTGTYQFDAESYSGQGDVSKAWYDDELKVNVKITQGVITAGIGLEISDDDGFDGFSDGAGKERSTGGDLSPIELIDNYYIAWATPVEGLSVKFGEYALDFGRKVVIYQDPAAHEIGILYNKLANVDLGFYIGKANEVLYASAADANQTDRNDDNDVDTMALTASVKGVEFFKKLDFIYASGTVADLDTTVADEEASFGYIGVDTAFAAGPVDVAIEYGSVSDDDAANEASFTYAEIGFDRIAGFDINLEIFDSAEDGSLEGRFGGNFFFPYQLYGFDSGVNGDLEAVRLIGVSGSYKLNDKMTLAGKILAQGTEKYSDESVGMEIDARMMYKFADNAAVQLTYATWSPGDAYFAGDGDSENAMRARFDYSF